MYIIHSYKRETYRFDVTFSPDLINIPVCFSYCLYKLYNHQLIQTQNIWLSQRETYRHIMQPGVNLNTCDWIIQDECLLPGLTRPCILYFTEGGAQLLHTKTHTNLPSLSQTVGHTCTVQALVDTLLLNCLHHK